MEDIVELEVISHDSGPGCESCGSPTSQLKVFTSAGDLQKGDLVWSCFLCEDNH